MVQEPLRGHCPVNATSSRIRKLFLAMVWGFDELLKRSERDMGGVIFHQRRNKSMGIATAF